MDHIRPFLDNVLRPSRASGRPEPGEGRGRRVPPERLEQVAHHYEIFGGVSPITAYTQKQADGLRERLAAAGSPLPVYIGMRNWHPFLADTLREMSQAGIRHAVGFIMAAQASYSSCEQYRENVRDARRMICAAGLADVEMTYVPGWHAHEGFIAANAAHVCDAIARLPAEVRHEARIVFTAHSIPTRMAEQSTYREQLTESSRLVAARAGVSDWALTYQSRSGRPEDPWLEPDVCDYLRSARADGLRAAVLCPIGFVCDHVEVLYDLDHEAAGLAHTIGLPLTRAAAVNDDPTFLDMMADVVLATIRRYATGRPLEIVHRAERDLGTMQTAR